MSSPPTLRTAPGPKGAPLIGVVPQIRRDSLSFFVSVARDFGDVAALDFGLRKFLLVTHPDGLKRVLQDNARSYLKGYDVVKPLLGDGLVTSDGDAWLRQRRLMQPAFHKDRIRGFLSTMAEDTSAMLDGWARAHRAGQPVDVAAAAMRLSQSIIVKTMFSPDGLGSVEEAERIAEAFNQVLEFFSYLMFEPVKLPEWVPTRRNRRFQQAVRTLEETVYRLIGERRRTPADTHGDLLSMLVHATDAETPEQMSDRQIRDEVMNIFLAGHETTATTVAWAWYLLSLHPEVMRRMEAEVDQALQGRVPTMEDFGRLVFTRMVVDETLRLYPAAWMFARVCAEDDELCGYRVPRGSHLMLSPYVVHRRADLWPNPEAFDPSRFAPGSGVHRHKFSYLPFSAGPRVCIGNNFALMEATLILAMAAQRFRMELVPGRPVHAQPLSTLRPQPGVWMSVQPRA